MLKLLEKMFGENNEAKLKVIQPFVEKINNLEAEFIKLSDNELKAKTPYFKNIIDNKLKNLVNAPIIAEDSPKIPGIFRNTIDRETQNILFEILPEAFATVREASKRILNMRHFDVQLIGGIVLHQTFFQAV